MLLGFRGVRVNLFGAFAMYSVVISFGILTVCVWSSTFAPIFLKRFRALVLMTSIPKSCRIVREFWWIVWTCSSVRGASGLKGFLNICFGSCGMDDGTSSFCRLRDVRFVVIF